MTTVSTCKEQYTTYIKNNATPWTNDYNLMAEFEEMDEDERRQRELDGYWTHPIVEAVEEEFGVADVLTAGNILLKILAIFSNFNSEYYYFFAGEAIGAALGYTITSFDKWFDLGIITPENPWDRYLDDGL